MRSSLIVTVAIGLVLAGSTPAFGQVARCSPSQGEGKVACAGSRVIAIPGRPAASTASSRAAANPRPSATVWVPMRASAPGPDGRRCSTQRWLPVAGWIQPDRSLSTEPHLAAYLDGLGPCPLVPRGKSAPSPAGLLAESFWTEVPLPVPIPHIAPGRAITGLPAYMETKGATTHRFGRSTPFGPMIIEATGTYQVDWGDGTTTGPHSAEGKAWPEGEIKHSYRDVGSYNVVVTQRWTATWSVGDESGQLDGLSTAAGIADFPVGQIQAVLVNPPR